MARRHKKFSNFIVISALFFSAFTLVFGNVYIGFSEKSTNSILGANSGTNEDALTVTSKITNVNRNSDESYSVDYEITLKNTSDKTINDLSLINDFKNTFPENIFTIDSLTSDNLFLDETFDGI